jgi:uncharacterized protein
MRVFLPVLFSIVVIAVLSALEISFLKKLHADWWRRKWVRIAAYAVPLFGSVGLLLWTYGIWYHSRLLMSVGAYLSATVFVIGIALMLSLPVSGFMHFMSRRLSARRKTLQTEEVSVERRSFLQTASLALPAAAISTGGAGLANTFMPPVLPLVPLSYPRLPRELEGFRILHISDIHLGFFIGLKELEKMVERCATVYADLVLLTGDLCDDPFRYKETLLLLGQISSRFGTFASLGNHEYYTGIGAVRKAFEGCGFSLLVSRGETVNVRGSLLHVAGADDPRSLARISRQFFKTTIDRAMKSAPQSAFSILMSHRPEGFEYAAAASIPLTLSGHTHGGQIGYAGRSIFESFMPQKYMWGLYEKNESKLYTSAGAGHWFPFRLGCPAEMPVYVLTSEIRPKKGS